MASSRAFNRFIALSFNRPNRNIDFSNSMTYQDLVCPSVLTQPVYEPGKPIEYVAKEFGLEAQDVLKLASNENPLGPSPKALEAVRVALRDSHLYPDGGCTFLRERLAEERGVKMEELIVGNGSNEVMVLLAQAFLQPGDEVVFGAQAFIVYKLATLLFGATPVEVPMPGFKHDLDLILDAVTEKTKLVFVPSPNNPTGTANTAEELAAFVDKLPEHVIFCFDEAYAEYLESPPDLRPLIAQGRKIFCTRTFSKIYGLAGFRIGYGYGSAELVALLNQIRQPFNVNAIAQVAARAGLEDREFVETSRQVNAAGLAQLTSGFENLGLETYHSAANFLLLRVEKTKEVFEILQSKGVITRPLTPYSMPHHLRISIGTADQNSRLLALLEEMLLDDSQAFLLKERPSK